MARTLDIACLQTRPMPDFERASDEALSLARQAVEGGSEMLFLPEYCGGLRSEGAMFHPPSAAEDAHPVLQDMRDFARGAGVWIMVGSIAVDGPDERIRNRGFMIDPEGEIRGRYDKIHLFDIALSGAESYRESATVAPGDAAVIHDAAGTRIGHTICYDLRFPALYRALAQAGADMLACPAAFTKRTGEMHWHILNRARAIETGSFMVSPCAVGPVLGGGESYGHSLIVDPSGEVLADGGTGHGVVRARIDLDRVAHWRGQIPSLSNGRGFAEPANAPPITQARSAA